MRKFTPYFLLFFGLLFSSFYINAQDTICPTKMELAWMQINAPDRYQKFLALENFTANYVATSGRLINPNGLIIIPIVVHVLHRGEPEGQGFNISLAQIQTQIDILNKDFRRLNADRVNTPAAFSSLASDLNIEFRLACIDPNGNPTNGVVRKYTSKAYFTYVRKTERTPDDVAIGVKVNSTGDAAWPTNRYLNIWVCNFHNLLGYGTFPADYADNPLYDGVVIHYNAFKGITSTSGRVLTHEIGHWLNLSHLEGDADADCGTDNVSDTPPQKRSTNVMGCPAFPLLTERCNTTDVSTMYMNFMSYAFQNCRNLFTNGQKDRARAIFATGAPNGRVAQLNGFFGFTNQPALIVCRGTVIVNAMCLAATWTVSGPATIVSGQNSYKLEIQATANGTVHLTATSGNYFAETDIPVTIDPVLSGYYTIRSDYHSPGIEYPLYANNSPVWLPANKLFEVNAYITTPNPVSPSWARAATSYPFNWAPVGLQLNISGLSGTTAYNERKGIFNFTADIGCGVRTTTFNWPIVVQGGSFSMSASPNPATDNLMVSIVDESAEVKAMSGDEIITMTLYSLNNTTVVKRWTFKNNQSKFNLNVSDVHMGHYILVVEKGKDQKSEQVLIE